MPDVAHLVLAWDGESGISDKRDPLAGMPGACLLLAGET
jgi:hypothetical protein